jgi:hypothetical protein
VHVVAIETNFNSLTGSYLSPDSMAVYRPERRYENILHYVALKGFRTGIFSEDPVGPKGVSNRWAQWMLPNPNTGISGANTNIRGNHLSLMNVPYFKTAVITTDRPDIWTQIMSNYNSTPLMYDSIGEAYTTHADEKIIINQ